MTRTLSLVALLALGCTFPQAAAGEAARHPVDGGAVAAPTVIAPAPPSGAPAPCTKDADCEISRLDPVSCCRTCQLRVLTRAAEEEESKRCAERTARCPEPSCVWGELKWGAICSRGQCALQQIRISRPD